MTGFLGTTNRRGAGIHLRGRSYRVMMRGEQRLMRGVAYGSAVGADEVARYVNGRDRALLVEHLAADAATYAEELVAVAREQAAAIVEAAHGEGDALRAAARTEGFARGETEGRTVGLNNVEPVAAMLRTAAAAAAEIRAAYLDAVEEQVVELALAIAERIIGEAAAAHAELAASLAGEALRATRHHVLQIRVHPADAEQVAIRLRTATEHGGEALRVQPDGAVQAGGCVIDVVGGTIDLQLGSQLGAMKSALISEDVDDGWRPVSVAAHASIVPAEE